MEFECRVASPTGEVRSARYVADSEGHLRRDLEDKGLLVLSVAARGGAGFGTLRLPSRQRISTRDFLIFNQELATLLRAGMPLVQSVDLLRGRVQSPVFKGLLDDVHTRLRGGAALSEAFDAHAAQVPTVYVAALVAGERSGSLDAMLRRFVEYTQVVSTVKKKTVSALVYPAILVSLAVVLVSVIVLKVVPAFSEFYLSFGAELPLVTRVIVAISDGVRSHALLLLLALAASGAAVLSWSRAPGQRTRMDRWLLRLPVVGEIATKFATSQMARTLATLLGGGLPLVEALHVAARSVGNRYFAAELSVVGARVREGVAFSAAMDARGIFPDVAVKMTEVGESTGALQDMLNTVADFYDEEISTSMDRFVTLVEPMLLVFMGIVIAGLLLALYMPLFQLSSVLTG